MTDVNGTVFRGIPLLRGVNESAPLTYRKTRILHKTRCKSTYSSSSTFVELQPAKL